MGQVAKCNQSYQYRVMLCVMHSMPRHQHALHHGGSQAAQTTAVSRIVHYVSRNLFVLHVQRATDITYPCVENMSRQRRAQVGLERGPVLSNSEAACWDVHGDQHRANRSKGMQHCT